MTRTNKFLGLLIAFALAAFALASGAAFADDDKSYTVTATPNASAPGTSPATVVLTLKTTGNSTFKAYSVVFPTSGYTVSATNATASNGSITPVAGGLQVNNINLPVGAQTETVTLTITGVTTTGTCGTALSDTWTVQPWTGSTVGNGTKFKPSPGTAKTYIKPQCYTATSTSSGDGSGSIDASKTVLAGNTATFSGTVNSGSSVAVSGCGGTAATTSNDTTGSKGFSYTTGVVPPAGCTVTANFTLNLYTVGTAKSGAGSWLNDPGSKSVKFGNTTTFDLTPAANSDFKGASGCGALLPASSTNFSFTTGSVPVTGCTVTATYALKQVTVKTSMSGTGTGTITPSADQLVDVGTPLTFQVKAGTTSRLGSGSVTGCSGAQSGPDASLVYTYNVTAPIGGCTVNAEFAANTLTITPPTGSIGAGVPIHIGVSGDGPPVVNVTASGTDCTVSPTGSIALGGSPLGIDVTIAQTIPPATHTCTLTVSADNYPSTNLTLTSVYAGVLGCTEDTNYDSSMGKTDFSLDPTGEKSYMGQPGWGLRRAHNYDPNEACVPVNYSCSLEQSTQVMSCVYDKTMQTSVVLKYLVLWPVVSIDNGADVWKDFRPWVSWGTTTVPPVYPDDYVPGQDCISDDETLGLALLPIIPSVSPWLGNTLPQYQPGSGPPPKTVKVCIAQRGSTSIGVDPSASPLGSKFLSQPWHILIDESDSSVKLPR